jgi:hypothetical protein
MEWASPEMQKPIAVDGLLRDLVAWDGIEPSTRGFSITRHIDSIPEIHRNFEQNQPLTSQCFAAVRSNLQWFAVDSRWHRQKL